MNYGGLRECDVANGEGVRVTLFVSGCNHHCPGCFNQEAQAFDYGELFTEETLQKLLDACAKPEIAGLSLLGGEPMDPLNQWTVLGIIQAFRERFGSTKDIWLWTGYRYDDFLEANKLYNVYQGKANIPLCTLEILKLIDVLVDGPFIEAQKNISLKFRGSSNQRILRFYPDSFLIDYGKSVLHE